MTSFSLGVGSDYPSTILSEGWVDEKFGVISMGEGGEGFTYSLFEPDIPTKKDWYYSDLVAIVIPKEFL